MLQLEPIPPQAAAAPIARSASCLFLDDQDAKAFSRISDEAKDDVRFKWRLMWRMNARLRQVGVVKAAEELARVIAKPGLSAGNLKRFYYDWREAHDWRVLAPAHELKDDAPLNAAPETIEHFRTIYDRYQRKLSPAWRAFINEWKAWRQGIGPAIPGCGSVCPPPGISGDYPAGWSERNWRRYEPTPFEAAAVHDGRQAAAAFRPLVKRTKAGLKPGQFFVFDDHEHNQKINLIGKNRKSMRPHELACMDLATDFFALNLFKPAIWNEVEEKKEQLRERDMRWLVATWMINIGWRTDTGTTLVVEHGTAAISPEMEQRLLELTRDKVHVQRGGIGGVASHAGHFGGPKRGNFRMKSPLESMWNYIDNEMSGLVGQTGKDRKPPEQLDGRDAYNSRLLAAAEALPAEFAAQLAHPFLSWSDWLGIVLQVYSRINRRENHQLEGYRENGWVAHEWRPSVDMPWMPESALDRLDTAARAGMDAVIKSDPRLEQSRVKTPAEVWQPAYERELSRAPGYFVPLLLQGELGVERSVKDNHQFIFEDADVGPGRFVFDAKIGGEWLRPGEKFLTYCNPLDGGRLYVCDAKGKFLGECPAVVSTPWDDPEAMQEAVKRAAKTEAELLAPVVRRGRKEMRNRIQIHRKNTTVFRAAAKAALPPNAARPRAGSTTKTQPTVSRADAELHEKLLNIET